MIKGLIEVIVYVKHMDAQVRFYRDILGLKVRFPAGLVDYSSEFWVELETGSCTLALHSGRSEDIGTQIPKLVFGVDDIQAARQMLLTKGVAASEVRSPAPGILVVDAFDPELNPFSLESHNH